jgi:hypothetical protein
LNQVALLGLSLRALRKRLLLLLAFSAVFLVAAAGARILTGSHEGHVELDRLFEIGGAPLASTLLLLGWVLGRFPLIAVLVLMAGVFSHDRSAGYTRLYLARPVSPLAVYGARFVILAAIAFALSAVLMPAFDVIMLGQWAGPATLVLIAAYVIVYGALATLLSAWTRGDSWLALMLAILAIVWHALRTGGVFDQTPPGVREVISLILPPHGALFAIERAFAELQPIPWDAFLYVVIYGALLLVLAGISITQREV